MMSAVGRDDFSHSYQPVRGCEFFWIDDNVSCLNVKNVNSFSKKKQLKNDQLSSLSIKHDQYIF